MPAAPPQAARAPLRNVANTDIPNSPITEPPLLCRRFAAFLRSLPIRGRKPDDQAGTVTYYPARRAPDDPPLTTAHPMEQPAPARDGATPGPDELKARQRMLTAITRYGWEKDIST